jgi:glycerophosphoryl diester phosphodiesterase
VTVVIAHRGASRAEHENTVAAFRRAGELGATWVELDVRRSVDDALVVHHDPHYPDGRPVAATPAAERPAHVPLLADALAACAPLRVNVEIKNSDDEAGYDPDHAVVGGVVALLAATGWTDRVLVSCFDRPTLDTVRRADDDVPTALLTSNVPADGAERDEWLAGVAADGHVALHPHWMLVDAELVTACHRLGLAVNVWTVDDPGVMARLAGWGVDGICTNVPDVAVAALG